MTDSRAVKKDKSTPANREFWEFVERTARDVDENFPTWKRGYAQRESEMKYTIDPQTQRRTPELRRATGPRDKTEDFVSTEEARAFLGKWGTVGSPATPSELMEAYAETKTAALEAEVERLKAILANHTSWKPNVGIIPPDGTTKNHGSCCYCPDCGHDHDSCVCEHNSIEDALKETKK